MRAVLEEHPTSWQRARAPRGGSVRVVLEEHPTIDFLALSEPQKMEHLLEVQQYLSVSLHDLPACEHTSASLLSISRSLFFCVLSY